VLQRASLHASDRSVGCVAVSVLQCACCSVCVAVSCSVAPRLFAKSRSQSQMCCSVCVAVRVLQCVAVCSGVPPGMRPESARNNSEKSPEKETSMYTERQPFI